ncbi:PIN domain-containing protein [Candidatus Curtissbacteria bacterium]|nr:PIN domain-containing protein [Candidatus Curtissbacteria bacterium]
MGLKIALDSNIFIYALENKGRSGNASRKKLFEIKETNLQVFTSVLTLQEILVGVYKEGLIRKVHAYLNFISNSGNISIVDFTRNIAIKSAQIRAQYKQIRTPDAIHLATALESGAEIFVTADRRLPRKINGLKIEVLS